METLLPELPPRNDGLMAEWCGSPRSSVVRIDREKKQQPSKKSVGRIVEEIRKLAPGLDGLIIEDYGKGLVTPELVKAVCEMARESDVKVMVDPNPNPDPCA